MNMNMNSKFLATTICEFLNEHKMLNEASFYNYIKDYNLRDEYIINFIKNGESEALLDWYMSINDLEDENEDDIKFSPEYFSYVRDELERHLEEAKENLYDKIDYYSNKITLYRAIKVDDNWINHLKTQGKRLGIYWSWDKDGAETHWGDHTKKNVAVIETEIDEKYVDWKITIEMNMNPNFSEEKEIRLFKNTPLKINSLTINDEEIDVSIFGDKIFYS